MSNGVIAANASAVHVTHRVDRAGNLTTEQSGHGRLFTAGNFVTEV